MARSTAVLIGAIIEVDSDIGLDPFINAASMLVTSVLAGVDTSESDLTQIETWLAAHYYAIRAPRSSSEKAGPVAESFDVKIDLGLNQTRYGQMALSLDVTGKLAYHNRKTTEGLGSTPSLTWLGTGPDD